MSRDNRLAEPPGGRRIFVVETIKTDVDMDELGRKCRQDFADGVVRRWLWLCIRAVPLPQSRQCLRQSAPMLGIPHDIPRAPHDEYMDIGQRS